MAEFCVNERHGGICEKTDTYCNLGACPYEEMKEYVPVRNGRCDVCSGKAVLTQDAYNGYSLEIDAEQQEAAVWQGDECLAVFHINFCPNCGADMGGGTMSNGDVIRLMTDEALAYFLSQWGTATRAWQKDPGETLYWLQKSVEEDENE